MKLENVSSLYKELIREKGTVCVSIIFPVNSNPFDKLADQIYIKEIKTKAEALIGAKGKSDFINKLIQKTKDAIESIDLSAGPSGIGIYISNNISKLITFPFHVKEKIIVDHSFETRHILLNDFVEISRFILMLTEKSGHLYTSKGSFLNEIKDSHFPAIYEEQYEYSKPSRGTSFQSNGSLKQFEKDKSTVQQMRQKVFYKNIDVNLGKYVSEKTPLLLTGAEKDIAYYEQVSLHKNKIHGKISGNLEYSNLNDLNSKISEAVRAHIDKETNDLLSKVRELSGRGLTTTGIKEIWKAVKEGKGLKLLVEEDFFQTAFSENGNDNILMHRVSERNKVISDVVDDLIEMVLDKNGEVVFLKNGQLHSYNKMVLINRYV